MIITAVVIAIKYYDDFYYKNTFYAKLGGIPTELLNQMEEEFLNLLNFNCYINQTTLKSYLERLEIFAELNLNHKHWSQLNSHQTVHSCI